MQIYMYVKHASECVLGFNVESRDLGVVMKLYMVTVS